MHALRLAPAMLAGDLAEFSAFHPDRLKGRTHVHATH
jgi:hypothetical protein